MLVPLSEIQSKGRDVAHSTLPALVLPASSLNANYLGSSWLGLHIGSTTSWGPSRSLPSAWNTLLAPSSTQVSTPMLPPLRGRG